MSVVAHVTFDLHDADSADYACVQSGLEDLKLNDYAYSSKGKYVELPYNTFMGEFEGVHNNSDFADAVARAVKTVFGQCNVHGKAFILIAGAPWVWRSFEF